ncbi:MAG: hypothetical protein U0354_07420 [Candidatus Sericytochromatia bacterium]
MSQEKDNSINLELKILLYRSYSELLDYLKIESNSNKYARTVLEALEDNFNQERLLLLSKSESTGLYVALILEMKYQEFKKEIREKILLNLAFYKILLYLKLYIII